MVNGTVNENENGNGSVNAPARFMVGGRAYGTYKEAVEAQDRRFEAFLRCGGVAPEEDLALRVVPDDAAPESYNPSRPGRSRLPSMKSSPNGSRSSPAPRSMPSRMKRVT